MTAKTSQHLADALRAAHFDALAERAEADEFHDFLSPHDLPLTVLAQILARLSTDEHVDARGHEAANNLRLRLIDGEFDASDEEAEAWARSEEGQDTFKKLTE